MRSRNNLQRSAVASEVSAQVTQLAAEVDQKVEARTTIPAGVTDSKGNSLAGKPINEAFVETVAVQSVSNATAITIEHPVTVKGGSKGPDADVPFTFLNFEPTRVVIEGRTFQVTRGVQVTFDHPSLPGTYVVKHLAYTNDSFSIARDLNQPSMVAPIDDVTTTMRWTFYDGENTFYPLHAGTGFHLIDDEQGVSRKQFEDTDARSLLQPVNADLGARVELPPFSNTDARYPSRHFVVLDGQEIEVLHADTHPTATFKYSIFPFDVDTDFDDPDFQFLKHNGVQYVEFMLHKPDASRAVPGPYHVRHQY